MSNIQRMAEAGAQAEIVGQLVKAQVVSAGLLESKPDSDLLQKMYDLQSLASVANVSMLSVLLDKDNFDAIDEVFDASEDDGSFDDDVIQTLIDAGNPLAQALVDVADAESAAGQFIADNKSALVSEIASHAANIDQLIKYLKD